MQPFQVSAFEKERMQKARRYLRYFLMDSEDMNRLIRGKELEDDRLEFAIEMCISDWNTTTPLLGKVTIANFPSLYLLIHGSAVQCLKMAGLYQSRNELTYSAGGSSFVRANKTPYYQSWIQNFSSEYEAKKLNMKIAQNIESCYGEGFFSEYFQIGLDW
jgi:hypothetical protein